MYHPSYYEKMNELKRELVAAKWEITCIEKNYEDLKTRFKKIQKLVSAVESFSVVAYEENDSNELT